MTENVTFRVPTCCGDILVGFETWTQKKCSVPLSVVHPLCRCMARRSAGTRQGTGVLLILM